VAAERHRSSSPRNAPPTRLPRASAAVIAPAALGICVAKASSGDFLEPTRLGGRVEVIMFAAPWPRRALGWLLLCASLGCGASGDAPSAEELSDGESGVSDVTGTVFGTDGDGLNVREAATTSSAVVGVLVEGSTVSIGCQTTGEPVAGSAVWNFLPAHGGFVADAFVWTGHDGFIPGMGKCVDAGTGSGSGSSSGSSGESGPLTIAGVVLSDTQNASMRYVAEAVVPEMRGSRAERIDKAAYVAWWSLKEGVFGLEDALGYSNCHFPPDMHIGPLDVCPDPDNAWQVGLSAVQAAWRTLDDVEWLAGDVHPDKSITQVLRDAAEAAGYAPGTSTGEAIVNSSARLRLSWLLRDAAVGFEAQYPTVQSECFSICQGGWESTCQWCFGTGWDESAAFAADRSSAAQTVAEIASLLDALAP
jgi:hypothetical protein